MKACCTGSSLPGAARCSTVTRSAPSRNTARVRQPETGLPSTSTVQQPHSPCPQLSRAPNRANCVCSISTALWCGFTSAVTGRPLRVKLIVRALISVILERFAGLSAQRAQHRFRSQRQFSEPHADGVVDGIGDGGRHAEGCELADALGAERAVALI